MREDLILEYYKGAGTMVARKYFRYYLQTAGSFHTGSILLPLGASYSLL